MRAALTKIRRVGGAGEGAALPPAERNSATLVFGFSCVAM